MNRYCLMLLLGLCCSSAVFAGDLEAGKRAWQTGQYQQAISIWQPLAEAGQGRAQLFMAWAYQKGKGVPRDPDQALYWYQQAAENDIPEAQYELGLMYELGEAGVVDYDESQRWYSRAVSHACPSELNTADLLGGE